jgi:hypothetical protein
MPNEITNDCPPFPEFSGILSFLQLMNQALLPPLFTYCWKIAGKNRNSLQGWVCLVVLKKYFYFFKGIELMFIVVFFIILIC